VTIHRGHRLDSSTVLGDRNFLMAFCHVAHDCVLGNEVTIVNHASLSGFVTVEDKAFISGYVGVHQFVRIGRLSIIAAFSKVVMDVAPFSIYDGHPAKFIGLNSVGLKRAGYSSRDSAEIKKALKVLFTSGLSRSSAVQKLKTESEKNKDIQYLLRFIQNSRRGVSGNASKLVE
jgi:UDP-N-acetylglucosamine acyltransferase